MSDDGIDLSGDEQHAETGKEKAAGKSGGKGGRPTTPGTEADLRKRIADGLDELVELIGEQTTIGAAVKADANRMAEVLAVHARKHALLGRLVVALFGKESAGAAVRAFGPTLRSAGHAWRERRQAQQAEATLDPGAYVDPAGTTRYVVPPN